MKRLFVSVLFFLMVFASCTMYFDEMLSRTADDPNVNAVLHADSFCKVNTVFLNWDDDPATDEYILYKADNNNGKNFVYRTIYSGNATSYTDSEIDTGKLYRYRLDRRRGRAFFTGRSIALGVGASIDDSLNADNSNIAAAYDLTYKVDSCCYHYKFDDTTILSNLDYYKVKIPAYMKAVITITGNNKNDFRYRMPGASSYRLLGDTGDKFEVNNNDVVERYCYFVISANPDNFVTALTPGGDIRGYKLELTELRKQ